MHWLSCTVLPARNTAKVFIKDENVAARKNTHGVEKSTRNLNLQQMLLTGAGKTTYRIMIMLINSVSFVFNTV